MCYIAYNITLFLFIQYIGTALCTNFTKKRDVSMFNLRSLCLRNHFRSNAICSNVVFSRSPYIQWNERSAGLVPGFDVKCLELFLSKKEWVTFLITKKHFYSRSLNSGWPKSMWHLTNKASKLIKIFFFMVCCCTLIEILDMGQNM